MHADQLNDDHRINSEADLRPMFPERHRLAEQKCQPQLDSHSREFILRSPFLCLGTQNDRGRADVSPRGDPPGSVKILDDSTLAIPDRPGNNRLDSLVNILANPAVGILFIVPGFEDTLRVNGQAYLSRDPQLLDNLAVDGKTPKLAVIVEVQEVFLHCSKAFRRSKMWDHSTYQDRKEMPTFAKIVMDQIGNTPSDQSEMENIDRAIEEENRTTLY